MKIPQVKRNRDGFTLMEVLVLICIICILVAFFLANYSPTPRPNMISCINNQRQIALSFIMWQTDNTNQFPWQISATNGGSMEDAIHGNAAANFRAVGAYVRVPQVFICPDDKVKVMPTNVATMSNANVSYFAGLDFNTNAAACILSGDRHLKVGETPVHPGFFVYTNGLAMGWTRELHGKSPKTAMGVVSFYDGHAELVVDARMDSVFNHAGLMTSRFDVP